jgi:hypothetical protein
MMSGAAAPPPAPAGGRRPALLLAAAVLLLLGGAAVSVSPHAALSSLSALLKRSADWRPAGGGTWSFFDDETIGVDGGVDDDENATDVMAVANGTDGAPAALAEHDEAAAVAELKLEALGAAATPSPSRRPSRTPPPPRSPSPSGARPLVSRSHTASRTHSPPPSQSMLPRPSRAPLVSLGGGISMSPATWARFQETLDCWAGRPPQADGDADAVHGRWEPAPTPVAWELSARASLFGRRNAAMEADPGLRHAWAPSRRCPAPYRHWNRAEFCALFSPQRSVLVVGDSLTRQFHVTLQDLTTERGKLCKGDGRSARSCRGHVLCEPFVGVNGTGGRGGGADRRHRFLLQWRRSDRLRLDFASRFELKWGFGEEQWLGDLAEASPQSGGDGGGGGGSRGLYRVLVLNRGAHYEVDSAYLAQMRATLTYLRQAHPELLVVVRTTPAGHAKCGSSHAPLSRRPRAARLPFKWNLFRGQNAKLRALVRREFPGVVLMDVEPATALRPDLHALGSRGKDCLHYKPGAGPIDNWVRMFYNILALADEWNEAPPPEAQVATMTTQQRL